jgi:hypothetical protein
VTEPLKGPPNVMCGTRAVRQHSRREWCGFPGGKGAFRRRMSGIPFVHGGRQPPCGNVTQSGRKAHQEPAGGAYSQRMSACSGPDDHDPPPLLRGDLDPPVRMRAHLLYRCSAQTFNPRNSDRPARGRLLSGVRHLPSPWRLKFRCHLPGLQWRVNSTRVRRRSSGGPMRPRLERRHPAQARRHPAASRAAVSPGRSRAVCSPAASARCRV